MTSVRHTLPPRPRPADDGRIPRVSRPMWDWFAWYARRLLRKKFHAVRLDRGGAGPVADADAPLVFYMNHPSWWDPMAAIFLAARFWPARRHYAPIDAAMLEKYRFFKKLGFFGVSQDGPRGGVAFLRTATAILAQPGSCLWVTAEGEFADPRRRPLRLRPGIAHLARRVPNALLVPVAVEYPFWSESTPELLLRLGPPVLTGDGGRTVDEWNESLAALLQLEMDALADAAESRAPGRFETLLAGGGGTNFVYDAWRRARAALTGQTFDPAHLPDAPIPTGTNGKAGRP